MIEPMKKYAFLVYHLDYEQFLDDIRNIGVMHIMVDEKGISEETKAIFEKLSRIRDNIKYLRKREAEPGLPEVQKSGEEILTEVDESRTSLEKNIENIAEVNRQLVEAKPWGKFSRNTIEKIEERGLRFRMFTISESKYDAAMIAEQPLEVISTMNGTVHLAGFETPEHPITIEADESRLPAKPYSTLVSEKETLEKEHTLLNGTLDKLASKYTESLLKYSLEVEEQFEYEKVTDGTRREAGNYIRLVEGWIPVNEEHVLKAYLDRSRVPFFVSNPEKGDKVPIKLKNNKFARKFEDLGELYSLPSYKELDLTPFYAPFYMLFFGFCLGDAGYGILMMVGALVARRKMAENMKGISMLVFYLGVATLLFGIIGGTFFGINLYQSNLPVYSSLQQSLENNDTDINNLLFYLSLILGGIQIVFGLFLKAANEKIQMGWAYAMSTIGWIVLILGGLSVYFLQESGMLSGQAYKISLYSVLGVAGLLILFLNSPGKNPLLNLGTGLWNSYNMVTGLVGDLLSYIRLFALGISSAILGFVFNSLAVSMSGDIPVVSAVFMILILLVGHSINLFMSGLGAFVHPLRLTFVEFYKNAGFDGGGKKYNPFRKLL